MLGTIIIFFSAMEVSAFVNNNIFISYIKFPNITPPANGKDRGRWCEDGLRFITIAEVKKSTIFVIKRVSHERN